MILYRCPVCGSQGLEHDPDDPHPRGFYHSYEICRCCGTNFGAGVRLDMPGGPVAAMVRLREKWVREGAKWWSRARRPPRGWDWRENLRAIGVDPDELCARLEDTR